LLPLKEIELALTELSCQREKCLKTFIDCNINWKSVSRLEKEIKEMAETAQLKDEANKKMAVEYKNMVAENERMVSENEKLIAENKMLRTKNEELTKDNQQMMQKSADDERARKVC
jgi:glycyl-tRNA synthetase alpha subunit